MVLMGTAEHNPPGAPEGNAGWVLVPFLGTVLIFSTRQLFVGRGLAGQSLIASPTMASAKRIFIISSQRPKQLHLLSGRSGQGNPNYHWIRYRETGKSMQH